MITSDPSSRSALGLYGRLADPASTLRSDPRSDPRMLAALAPYGLDLPPEPFPIPVDAPLEQLHGLWLGFEDNFQKVFEQISAGAAPVPGISCETTTVTGRDGNAINLYIHRPKSESGEHLPCVVHLHGGGQTILQATDSFFVRWRDELAATGMVVVGVEFRNASGKLGNHPFPAGLHDCATATQWVIAHAAELGISNVVVSGESGGGNLTLAVTLLAKREGWVDDIAGVYALCPTVSNRWLERPPELPSLTENDGYFINCEVAALFSATYDPAGSNSADATCWPLMASDEELRGLPPHVISVNELDLLRDEGLAYLRRLWANGVPAAGRTVHGTCHGGDVLLLPAIPEVSATTINGIKAFAAAL